MKTDRRHELETNSLDNWIKQTLEKVNPYLTPIIVGAVAVVAVVFGAMWFSSQSEASQAAGWERYYDSLSAQDPLAALTDLAEEYENTAVGASALLRLGDTHLAQGNQQLFIDRTIARDELDSALTSYQQASEYAASIAEPLLEQRALLGLAQVRESLGELDEAQEQYKTLADRFPDGVFAGTAQDRYAALSRKPVREFYDWFDDQNPRPQLDSTGLTPEFDLDSLPDIGSSGDSLDLDLNADTPIDLTPNAFNSSAGDEPSDDSADENQGTDSPTDEGANSDAADLEAEGAGNDAAESPPQDDE